jgi:serine kinase of HPr protein (carbohydrate metabolism regulator)
MIIHAGCVALSSPQGWRGVLIQGPSGVGKSDLALRLIDEGFRLVSDDRTQVWRSQERLFAACPESLSGLIEARGLGIVPQPSIRLAEVWLAVRCLSPAEPLERMPDAQATEVCGAAVPLLQLHPLEASAPAKLRRALASIGHGAQGAYQAFAATPRGRGIPVRGGI